jgi:putative addiction module killer protein
MFSVEYYVTSDNVGVFMRWLKTLRDDQAKTRVIRRIALLERGGLGDCKPLRNGVWELRVDYGPGYRIYYGMVGKTIVLLLCGGDKRTQDRDIANAVAYFEDYKRRAL